MSLILPKGYDNDRTDYLYYSMDELEKKLEQVINENQKADHPYFILFKQKYDHFDPNLGRAAISVYNTRPPLLAGSIVWIVDNKRGVCLRLWAVNTEGRPKFNTEGVKNFQDLLSDAGKTGANIVEAGRNRAQLLNT